MNTAKNKNPLTLKEIINLKQKKVSLLITLISLLAVILITFFSTSFLYGSYCRILIPARDDFGNSPVRDKDKVYPGFTLFTPLNVTNAPFEKGTVYLVDLYGRPVHTWKTNYKVIHTLLKPNGNLLVNQANLINKNYPPSARTTSIQELDQNSNIVWEYTNDALHHDFDVLPNNNIAVLVWEKSPIESTRIIGGRPNTEFNKDTIFSDAILEIDSNKNVVWEWHAADHLDPADYPIPSFFTREQWLQANSIQYLKSNPINNQEAYLVSMRLLNTVFMVNKKDGKIIWQSPKGILGHQHDPTLLENGNILIFNNGFYSYVNESQFSYGSSVLEINPLTNKVVWEFSGGNNPLDRARLTEVILSGAQRLPNNNTLITLGTSGRLIEVTPDKKVVWDFINPYSDATDQPFPSNYIFKARRYFSDQIPWLNQFESSESILLSVCN